jgi:hypothetical protein
MPPQLDDGREAEAKRVEVVTVASHDSTSAPLQSSLAGALCDVLTVTTALLPLFESYVRVNSWPGDMHDSPKPRSQ